MDIKKMEVKPRKGGSKTIPAPGETVTEAPKKDKTAKDKKEG